MRNKKIYTLDEFADIMERSHNHKAKSGEVDEAFQSRLRCPNCGETFIPIQAIMKVREGFYEIVCPICNLACMGFQQKD